MTSPPDRRESSAATGIPPHRATPALVMSLLLHVVLLIAIAVVWTKIPRGTGGAEDRPIGIALVHRLPERNRHAAADSQPVPAAADAAAEAAAPPADAVPPIDLAGVLETIRATPTPASQAGLAGETGLGEADFTAEAPRGRDSTLASQTTTTVFGVSGSGSRFVYVFDRSDSMNGFGGKPLRAAKRELVRSLQTLTDRQQFQIVFYNDKPTPFRLGGVPLRMIPGEPGYVRHAESYIRSVAAFGGTSHEEAILMALRMGPDVVFFLSDARIPRLSQAKLQRIKIRADSVGATIHAIEFGGDPVAPADSFLRDLATMNRGQYQYIDVRKIGQTLPSGSSQH